METVILFPITLQVSGIFQNFWGFSVPDNVTGRTLPPLIPLYVTKPMVPNVFKQTLQVLFVTTIW